MRYAIVSDIHGNLEALDAVLADAAGRADAVLCLGDVVGYGADPRACVERLAERAQVITAGNHEHAVAGLLDLGWFNRYARAAAEWTRGQLFPNNLRYLQGLPGGPLKAEGVALVHGAVEDEDEYVLAGDQALAGLLHSPCSLTFFGHTHIQGGFFYDGAKVERVDVSPPRSSNLVIISLNAKTRYLLNPGSVGQPRDSDPRAAFAIADLEKQKVEFWRTPYDISAVQDRMERAGAPEALVLRLAFGR